MEQEADDTAIARRLRPFGRADQRRSARVDGQMRAFTMFVVAATTCCVIACERDPRYESSEKIASKPPEAARAAPEAAKRPDIARPEAEAKAKAMPEAQPKLAQAQPKLAPAPPRPAIAIAPPRGAATAERAAARAPAVRDTSELPVPPSDDPAEYAEWLRGRSRRQQQRIAAVCRAHPRSYEVVCGGIGPLHIPLPPHIRARMPQPGDRKSRFASMEAWQASLTTEQQRYVEKMCTGGEDRPSSALCGDNTPLVVALEGQPVRFTSGGTFAFAPGVPVASDWPTAATPWIALDRNGDGAIDSGAELFGSNTVLPDGTTARNGFVALAALDANGDGRIDARDPAFASLVLWADRDGDRRSTPGELAPLSASIVSISLDDHVDLRCDARDNCEGERATLVWRDARGEVREGSVVDVYLPRR
jgi:hypothetical protein